MIGKTRYHVPEKRGIRYRDAQSINSFLLSSLFIDIYPSVIERLQRSNK